MPLLVVGAIGLVVGAGGTLWATNSFGKLVKVAAIGAAGYAAYHVFIKNKNG